MHPLAIFAALAATVTAVCAQEHQHPPQDAAIHERFYSTWMRPDQPNLSCCSMQDCYPTEARYRNGSWYARRREFGDFVRIPPEKIEHNRDNPDGRNHVCMSIYGQVFCFIIAGSGT